MRKWNQWLAGGVATLAIGLTLGFVSDARSQRVVTVPNAPLRTQIATATQLKEEDVDKVLTRLGPTIAAKLARGETVDIQGLGTWRVVRIPAHRDLIDGRPGTIFGHNYVEFLPVGEMNNAANSTNAIPAEIVPPFQYNPLPGQLPNQKAPYIRAPNIRTP